MGTLITVTNDFTWVFVNENVGVFTYQKKKKKRECWSIISTEKHINESNVGYSLKVGISRFDFSEYKLIILYLSTYFSCKFIQIIFAKCSGAYE